MSALSTPRSPSPRDFANFATMTEEELSESLIYLTCPICEQVRLCRNPCCAAGPSSRESFSLCHAAARWAALPQQVMVPAVVLLLQAPLELGVAVGALYAAVTATVAERKQSRRYS